jgi:large subunit ribosomal protein L29
MNASELRAKDPEALNKELGELLKAHFSLRMQIATQQLEQHQPTAQDAARHRAGAHGAA